MLVVLSEINNLKSLQGKGVYPDEFYTDLEIFKNRTVFMKEATILAIFAGNCHFNKRVTIEIIKALMRRAVDEHDTGIKNVYVLSDMTLAGIGSYYRYLGNIDRVDVMHGWKCVRSGADIWKALQTPQVEATCYFNSYDKGDSEHLVSRYHAEVREQDPYRDLIQVPDLAKMFAQAV